MGRSRKSTRAAIEAEEESQEIPEDEPEVEEDEPEADGKSMNKSQAARAAIDAGYDKPVDAVPWMKSTFGIEMRPQHFSAIKSNYKKQQEAEPAAKAAEPSRRGPKPKAAATSPASVTARSAQGGESGLLADVTVVKNLVERLGADQVREIVGLFE